MAEVNKNQIILDMCMTHRHDFGLDAKESESTFPSSGMTEQQRAALHRDMEQLYEHHFEKVINAQAARIAELERECERLRKDVDKRIKQGQDNHEMLNNVLRENAELRGELILLRSSEAHELGKLRSELKVCRKDAERYRWVRERAWYVDRAAYVYEIDHVKVSGFKESAAYDADDVEAAIDAAMKEGGV
ncbi:hypothetical protein [Pseudomonas tohonis]|uniref:hypothetical protein n=1 Tax=Pseudomonas tohonis TaxID=2725477 RepID=UPI001F1B324E|nr:hypothetical protein [Pseudomonas tohonis]